MKAKVVYNMYSVENITFYLVPHYLFFIIKYLNGKRKNLLLSVAVARPRKPLKFNDP